MENDKINKRLVEELNGMKSWMKFLDNKSNYNKSFHNPTPNNAKLIREGIGDDPNDQYGSPEETSDDLILGNDQQNQETESGDFIVISTDINGGIYVKMVQGEDENDALQQTENEMIIQTMVIGEDQLMELISKLSQYLPEDITSGENPDKPPFIDEPAQDVIDEDSLYN